MSPKQVVVEKPVTFPLNDPNSATVRIERPPIIPGPVPTTPRRDETQRVPVPDPSKGENYPSPG